MIQKLFRVWAKERDPIAWLILSDAVEEEYGPETKEKILEDLKRDFESSLEREKLEWILGEQGNLERKPWRPKVVEALSVDEGGRISDVRVGRLRTIGLWMEHPPEYLQHELEEEHGFYSEFRTVYTTGGGFYHPDDEYLLDEDNEVWRRVHDGTYNPEVECPLEDWDELERRDARDRVVAREETWYGEDPNKGCRYCGEDIGSPHRSVYLGEGAELVYLKMVPHEDEED